MHQRYGGARDQPSLGHRIGSAVEPQPSGDTVVGSARRAHSPLAANTGAKSMGESAKSRIGRPRSVTGLGVVLIVIGVLALLNMARGLVGYFQSAAADGIATEVSLGEFLLVAPEQTLVPAAVGIIAGIACLGVLRGHRWGQILAIGVGAATLLGGVRLLVPAIVEWGVPGSFSILLLPPAFVAFLVGAYVLYAALVNRSYFSQ